MHTSDKHFLRVKSVRRRSIYKQQYLSIIIVVGLLLNISVLYYVARYPGGTNISIRMAEHACDVSGTESVTILDNDSSQKTISRSPTEPTNIQKYLQLALQVVQNLSKSRHREKAAPLNPIPQKDEDTDSKEGGGGNYRIRPRERREVPKKKFQVYYGGKHEKNHRIPVFVEKTESERESPAATALGYFLDAVHITDLISEIIRIYTGI